MTSRDRSSACPFHDCGDVAARRSMSKLARFRCAIPVPTMPRPSAVLNSGGRGVWRRRAQFSLAVPVPTSASIKASSLWRISSSKAFPPVDAFPNSTSSYPADVGRAHLQHPSHSPTGLPFSPTALGSRSVAAGSSVKRADDSQSLSTPLRNPELAGGPTGAGLLPIEVALYRQLQPQQRGVSSPRRKDQERKIWPRVFAASPLARIDQRSGHRTESNRR